MPTAKEFADFRADAIFGATGAVTQPNSLFLLTDVAGLVNSSPLATVVAKELPSSVATGYTLRYAISFDPLLAVPNVDDNRLLYPTAIINITANTSPIDAGGYAVVLNGLNTIADTTGVLMFWQPSVIQVAAGQTFPLPINLKEVYGV